jgi:hypothetical protein
MPQPIARRAPADPVRDGDQVVDVDDRVGRERALPEEGETSCPL